jgi:YbgC/YbaW family acyl-CoA thioester hydrolase
MSKALEHTESLRVAWVDTDAGGRIHFTAAFRWAEVAESALCRRLGLMDEWATYPRRHVEADFLRVLVFDDEIDVRIRPENVGRTSITWAWDIRRGDELCVEGRTVCVHVDDHGRPTRLSEKARSALAAPAAAA